MIRAYTDAALERARYTQLEDGSYCAEVRGLRGAIATGATLGSPVAHSCRRSSRSGFSSASLEGSTFLRSGA